MAEIVVGGCAIRYEERGSGVPVVLTPGGRWGGYVMGTLAGELARDHRVITWDRPNTDGGSSVVTWGDASEADIRLSGRS